MRIIFLPYRSMKYPLLMALLMATSLSIGCHSTSKNIALTKLWLVRQKSKDKQDSLVTYTPPSKPYKLKSHPELDALWWNNKSKSSISYLSNCSSNSQALQEIQEETLSQIKKYKLLDIKKGKRSIYTVVQIHHPDQKKTIAALYIFQKKTCFYILNLITESQQAFNKQRVIFDQFIKTFTVKNSSKR